MVDLLERQIQKNVNSWLNGNFDDKTKQQVKQLLEHNPKELTDAFYTHLTFGTAGIRGIMGVGTNRMNIYTVGYATQALADTIKNYKIQDRPVFIGYDCRHNSPLFAEQSAKILAANGITVFICQQLRPTPFVSFGCRKLNCSAAIMITASHNPPEYNGYKVYWSDGGQVTPPYDIAIAHQMEEVIKNDTVLIGSLDSELIHWVGLQLDEQYLEAVDSLQLYPEDNKKHGHDLHIVYSSLHGTGITLVPQLLGRWGFSNLSLVSEQNVIDGDFPTAKKPNPEEAAALKLAEKQLQEQKADLLIATDPDADRLGVAVLHQGGIYHITGNQLAALCLEHICQGLKKQRRTITNGAVVKSVGTTELVAKIAKAHGFSCINTLTGFKYIAELIHLWETKKSEENFQFVFGAEESCGYLFGTIVRDKDAVTISAIVCEMALQAKLAGKTLIDELQSIWQRYGLFIEKVASIHFEESQQGRELMSKTTLGLRTKPPETIAGLQVVGIEDFVEQQKYDLRAGTKERLVLPPSDGVLFWLEDGTKILVRPSGTEPKVKLYIGIQQPPGSDIAAAQALAESHITKLIAAMEILLRL